MPGRTRRVRLLAVVLCIVTVFFLYERNAAQVDSYADYLTHNGVGGGAVIRKPEDKEQEPLPAPEPVGRPVAETTATKVSSADVEETTKPTIPSPSPSPSSSATEEDVPVTPAPSSNRPVFYEYDGIDELGDDEPQAYFPTSTLHAPQHWTKLPEKFPITSTIQLPTGSASPIPRVQKQGKAPADKERLNKIRDACKHAWKGFRTEGWGYDEVKPISGGGQNSFNGWGATLVDSLDTLWIMGLKAEFEEAVNKTGEIDFTYSSRNDIPLFEVTIRYLGGMLGAYDVSGRKYPVLLEKAVELAEVLYSAFDTPNRMPETYYHWKPAFAENKHLASTRVVMAEIGTLSLEFTRLAQLSGEPKYYDAIARITDEFEKWQNHTRLPGMWPTDLDASGCKKPVRKAPTPVQKQIPVPEGDSYMLKSEPVKIDADTLAKAEHAVDELSKQKNTKLGSVADLETESSISGVTKSDSSLRHSMDEDNWKKIDSSILGMEKNTQKENANAPLPPGPGSASKLEDPSIGRRPSDPLLPNAGGPGGAPVQKRQVLAATSLNDTSSIPTIPEPQPHQVLRKQTYDDEDEEEGLEVDEEIEEPQCLPQGFESCSKYGQETFTLGGKSDSTYEYLPKEYLLLGGRVEQYKTMYLDSMKPVIERLIFRPMTKDDRDILVSGELFVSINYTDDSMVYSHRGKLEHLTCFAGGMFAMGGKLFDLPEHIEIGRKLTDGCVWAYSSTNSGIMPDGGTLFACEDKDNCKWNETAWHRELDPFDNEFRIEQINDWKKAYGVDDVEAWKKAKVAEQAAYSSSTAAAALAAKTAKPVADDDDDFSPSSSGYDSDSDGTIMKRQSLASGLEDAEPAGPMPLPAPKPSPTETPIAPYDQDEDDIWGGHVPYGSAYDDDDDAPTTTEPALPLYTPDPPPTHKQYVLHKIDAERIPPGFIDVGGRGYILRPEAIESVFYMYRITHEQYWRDVGWKMFEAVEQHSRTPFGHSSLNDVTMQHPNPTDKMESFWIAETLKYFYLLFDDSETWSLDEWVLNTEAHFFRRPENPAR